MYNIGRPEGALIPEALKKSPTAGDFPRRQASRLRY
jgi:hypothetical protein